MGRQQGHSCRQEARTCQWHSRLQTVQPVWEVEMVKVIGDVEIWHRIILGTRGCPAKEFGSHHKGFGGATKGF